MGTIEPERWASALRRVSEIERKSTTLKTRLLPRKFTYSRRSAWATAAGLAVLPQDQQPELPGIGHIYARVKAESVLIGKFDVDEEVRLRAFYPRQGLSIRYQTGGKSNGITRTVNAHKRVHPHAPELMPTIHEHGTILKGKGAYLIEDTVQGEPATTPLVQELITPLTSRLHRVHQGVGTTSKPLHKIVGGFYSKRWNDFVEERENVDLRIHHAVRDLITRNALLEVSVTHGDLVNSNILVSKDDFVLVDWEFAAQKPIAFDMAKIIINVRDVETTLDEMHAGLGGTIGESSGHYTFREQVALALVLTLSWYPNHAAKAATAGRMGALQRQTTKRLKAIQQLLEIR